MLTKHDTSVPSSLPGPGCLGLAAISQLPADATALELTDRAAGVRYHLSSNGNAARRVVAVIDLAKLDPRIIQCQNGTACMSAISLHTGGCKCADEMMWSKHCDFNVTDQLSCTSTLSQHTTLAFSTSGARNLPTLARLRRPARFFSMMACSRQGCSPIADAWHSKQALRIRALPAS